MSENFMHAPEMEEIKKDLELPELEVKGSICSQEDTANWTGGVSTYKRLESGEITENDLGERLEQLPKFFTETTVGAEVRCVDERPCSMYDSPADYPDLLARPLGPQVPGGTPADALAWRMSEGFERNATFAGDTKEFITSALGHSHKFVAGGHTDSHHDEGKCGCGALDNLELIVSKLTSTQSQNEVKAKVQTLLGGDFDEAVYDEVASEYGALASGLDYYLGKNAQGEAGYAQEALEKVKEVSPHGVEELVGQHNGVIININRKSGTTFHRDEFSRERDGRLQAFNYDVWYTAMQAEELYPNDNQKQLKYITARVSYAVGTAMALFDGTLIETETR